MGNLGAAARSERHSFRLQNLTLFETPQGLQEMPVCTKALCPSFVPLNPPPPPNQQSDGFPLEFLLKGPQTELRTPGQKCEQTLQKLRTNRIMNKRAFLIFFRHNCSENHLLRTLLRSVCFRCSPYSIMPRDSPPPESAHCGAPTCLVDEMSSDMRNSWRPDLQSCS